MTARYALFGTICLLAANAAAQSDAPTDAAMPTDAGADVAERPPAESADGGLEATSSEPAVSPAAVATPSFLTKIQIHGFVSEGAYLSTQNDYIGDSERGSVKFFEGGINFGVELTDQLRVGLQLVSRSVGAVSEEVPRLDWAVIDYRFRPWLGLRAGVIKMPFGLYNEYVSVDAARTAVLLPQSVYPIQNRDALISHTGFSLYGSVPLALLGSLDYQAWLGKLSVPASALELDGAQLDAVDTRYVAGGQLFWHPPVEGLRIGGSYLRASIDFDLTLDADLRNQVVMAGLVEPNYGGKLGISQNPASFWVVSAEYTFGDLLVAAEYSRWLKHQVTTEPQLIPTLDEDKERFYGLLSYRLSSYLELGTYYSVSNADVDDRRGSGAQFDRRYRAFQRDLAGSVRLDVNEYWLWKLEAHYIDGAADLSRSQNLRPTRHWGLFLLRTTVTF